MQQKLLVWILALSTLFFAILMPPEAFPEGRMAVVVGASFVFLVALSEKRIPLSYVVGGAIVFSLLLIHSLLLSVDIYRSVEMLTVFWAYYCLAGFFIYSPANSMEWFAGSIVVLSLIVSGYGLYQFFWGFDQTYNYIFYSSAEQMVKAPALQLIGARRVYSTLTLPGTLWGFLVVALPIHGVLWKRYRVLDVVLVISAVMLLTTGLLTRSFGFVAGLFVLAIATLWLRNRKLLWNRTALVVVLALSIITSALFYSARRSSIEEANPVTLRFANWISAWNAFSANPWGTGLNTFGIVYPQYIQPGANETQFVHNTLLQLLSELGYPLIAAACLIIVINAKTKPRIPGSRTFAANDPRFYLCLALAVWIFHNLIDIDVYFPSVGVLGTILVALLLQRSNLRAQKLPGFWIAAIAVASFAVVVFSGMVFVSSELQNRAQGEHEAQKRLEAAATLEDAKQICPINSSLYYDSGDVLLDLYQRTRDQKFLVRAISSFQRAIQLSPNKVGPHIGLSLCLSSAHNLDAAIQEIHTAGRLYPGSPYVLSISKLMEQRLQ